MRGRSLSELATLVDGRVVGPDVEIADATHDSRRAEPGCMYIAIMGSNHDGHEFIDEAVDLGASAVCVNQETRTVASQLVVKDTRASMGVLSSAVHGDPSRSVPVVGVTGTNGKTTVTHFIESILMSAGIVPGLIGTIHTRVGDREFDSPRTTPEATDFQRLLAQMRDRGAGAIATEISSHALALGRVAGTRFAVAAFTNLTQDHLDFHGSMERYGAAKRTLFSDYHVDHAVINIDDPFGADLAAEVDLPLTTIGTGGDLVAGNVHYTGDATSFTLLAGGSEHDVVTPIIGEFNVENLMIAIACCLQLGLDLDRVIPAVSALSGVPGRFELVSGDQNVRAVVDYAHTPDSIRAAVDAARGVFSGRVIALVGAGGDRDPDKRALMGKAASAADFVVITSDNPRSEDPGEIVAAVVAGVKGGTPLIAEVDRARAIALALDEAKSGDVVLVLGKGHETGQEVNGVVLPFDDRSVVRNVLGRRESEAPKDDSGSMRP